MRLGRATVAVLVLCAAPSRAQTLSSAAREALEEAVFMRTVSEQGGRSHASGDRPELGPAYRDALSASDRTLLRIGLTPTAFAANGAVALEYDTAAAHNHGRVELTATGRFELLDGSTGETIFSGDAGEVVSFERSPSGFIDVSGAGRSLGAFPGPLRARAAQAAALLLVPSMRRINRLAPLVDGSFPLTPPAYRGELEVLPSTADPRRLRLVNVVELEDYVPGVVVNESLGSFQVEALRAQAITARGYALANRGRFADRGFDIDDSTLSQVYRGQTSETDTAVQAARGSEGLVVTSGGRILSALYSSSMGGHTESNEYVFPTGGYPGANADPALRAIHDSSDPLTVDLQSDAGVLEFYSTVYPGSSEVSPITGAPLTSLHRWNRARTAAELLARLKESFGVPSGARRVSDLRTTMRGASGRMMQVVVKGDWGSTTISGWSDLRRLATVSGVTPGGTAAGSAPNSPSTYVIARDPAGDVATVSFVGGGFGHNVGMSQYGAQGRALRGQTAEQILSAYYMGVEIGTAPQLLSGAALRQRFRSTRGQARLIVEGQGLEALTLTINGRRFVLTLPPSGTVEVDLDGVMTRDVNEVVYEPDGPGRAVVRVRVTGPDR